MNRPLEQKAAAVMAIADKIIYGHAAKPSGYWGVAIDKAHELDALLKAIPQADLAVVLDRFCMEAVKL